MKRQSTEQTQFTRLPGTHFLEGIRRLCRFPNDKIIALASMHRRGKPTNTLAVIATGSGSWEFLFTGEPGRTYRLQGSTNLIDWLDLSTNTPANGLFRFVDPDAMKLNWRFYRTVSP